MGDRRLIVRSEIGVNRPGTFAQFVAVPVESLVPPPPAGCPSNRLALRWSNSPPTSADDVGDLAPGVVLITGASGGVGVASTQLAAPMLHTVIGLSRSTVKSQKLRELGVELVVDPNDGPVARKVKDFLKPRRVDLAIDTIGGRSSTRSSTPLAKTAA